MGPTPSTDDAQTQIEIDNIQLDNANFLHYVDRISGWYEIGLLRRRNLITQVLNSFYSYRVYARIVTHHVSILVPSVVLL